MSGRAAAHGNVRPTRRRDAHEVVDGRASEGDPRAVDAAVLAHGPHIAPAILNPVDDERRVESARQIGQRPGVEGGGRSRTCETRGPREGRADRRGSAPRHRWTCRPSLTESLRVATFRRRGPRPSACARPRGATAAGLRTLAPVPAQRRRARLPRDARAPGCPRPRRSRRGRRRIRASAHPTAPDRGASLPGAPGNP